MHNKYNVLRLYQNEVFGFNVVGIRRSIVGKDRNHEEHEKGEQEKGLDM